MTDHTRDLDPRVRQAAGAVVVAGLPIRIGHDRVPGDRVPCDALRAQARGRRDGDDVVDRVGVRHRPLEGLHPTERAAARGQQTFDAQLAQERALRADHVADRDHGESAPVRTSGSRVRRVRPGRAAAAADEIGAHDEVAIGVERLARPDHAVPPAEAGATALRRAHAVDGRGRVRVVAPTRGMRVARERVADEHDVVLRRRERAVCLVGDADRRERRARIEWQRVRQVDEPRADSAHAAAVDDAHAPQG